MFNRITTCGLLCGIVLLLAACGQTPIPTAVPTEAVLPTAVTTSAYEPIDTAECAALRQDLAAVLGVEIKQGTGTFEDYALGGHGTGCMLTAEGTGEEFGSELVASSMVQFMLEDQGWEIDIRYTAGGPTGSAFGMRQGNRLALVAVMWTPTAGANCPHDQPISECALRPAQMLFTITVRVAQR